MEQKHSISNICNDNTNNLPSDEVYASFNSFIFSDDIRVTGKLLHRFKHFLDVKHLPGDIVEIGVFKGSGVATFTKFIEIFCPNSNKKVIGFDIFDTEEADTILSAKDGETDRSTMNVVYNKVNKEDLSLNSVKERLKGVSNQIENRVKLVQGDVEDTLPKFLKDNPGFRASLIYIDVDIARPTYVSMKYLWDRLLPGGVILFDEYEYHVFSESAGVDKFLQETGVQYNLVSTDWIGPTAYMRKPK
tara:strand:- start:3818 stop:4555 length:738 start_codon:yes stop_codon:yes gene_type:complete